MKQNFLFETGQETPVTLMRLIEDVGTGNLELILTRLICLCTEMLIRLMQLIFSENILRSSR